jgi:DNL zinc finger
VIDFFPTMNSRLLSRAKPLFAHKSFISYACVRPFTLHATHWSALSRTLPLLKAIRHQSTSAIPQPTETHTVIGFTCKVCDHRQYKKMSKHAYNHGVVLIKCDGCKSNHLIADHLGWYEHGKPAGTIEDILKAKGESVQRMEVDGMTEYVPKEIDELASAATNAVGGSQLIVQ